MLRSLVQWCLYPTMLASALGVVLHGIYAGWNLPLVVMAAITLSSVPLLLLQRWMPAEREWFTKPKHLSLDLLHMVTTGITTEALRGVVVAVVLTVAIKLHTYWGGDFWPTSWPLLMQFGLAMLIGDFGTYWVHRTCHAVPLMWRVHAMHHSSEKMYVFAAARNHPMNAFLMHSMHVLPLTLLGAPGELIALTSVFTGVNGMAQHANVDLRFGWFNYIFATADLHRWHHSADYDESNTNFGNNLIIWDWLFGTRYLPAGRPEEVGLGDMHLPENYFAHLVSPFFLNRLLVKDEPEEVPTR
jgi:sterol desaturase/sphingolipid hydroxylase (fatty acid hydroxylase superfamily)